MKTKATQFIYQDTAIHFALSTNKNVMVNATEMAKAFRKEVRSFLRLEGTKKYIDFLVKKENIRTDVHGYIEKNIVYTNNKAGTYMTRKLALKFATWLDVEFEDWVFDTIDEILFGDYLIHQNAIEETFKAEKELEVLENKLSENPNFKRMQYLQEFIKTKDSEKRKALAARKAQIKMDFNTKE